MPGRLALTLALAVVLFPRVALTQSAQSETETTAPAHVSHVEGTATLEREGRPENAPLNMPLLSGDRLKTADGRVEVLFADGSALHMDLRSTLDIQSDELVRLIEGRLRLHITGPARSVAYRVDSPAGSVRITQPGEYRVAMLRGQEQMQLELAVLRGSGEIFTDEGTTPVRAGERAYASAGLAPSYAYTYNSANWDAFDRWSESRRDTRLGVSAQYLPSEVRAYSSTLDEYGDWRYEQSHGYVWYPRVAVSWRPYYYGRWAPYPRYGWTWIGADRFAWPTHHYGRWGFSAGAWFWIPANRWAPAYVSWAYAPGYVSWCPLGFNNRPVIAINIFNVGPGYYSSARAWTAIGYSHFGRDDVHRRAVDWNRFDNRHRGSFQVGRSAPAYRDVAVPRNSTPIQWAGSRAVPTDRLRQGSGGQGGSQSLGAGPASRSRNIPPANSRTEGLPSSGGGTGNRAVPRYTNRGDEIVRSPSERPSASSPGSVTPIGPNSGARDAGGSRGYAVQRTAPAGPARRIDAPGAATDGSAMDRSRAGRDAGAGRYVPRPIDQAPGRAEPFDGVRARPRGGVTGLPDNPVYQPQPYQPPIRTYERSGGQGPARSAQPRGVAPSREPAVEAAPSAPPGYARPRGGFESRPAPAPNAGSGRQAPAPRAMPSPERSAPSGGTAVPRGGRGGA